MIIEEVLNLINAQLKNNNIKVTIKGEDFSIQGYRNRLAQVILNLINNAKEAILEEKDNGEIIIVLNKNNKTLSISDTGKAIDEEIKNRIFEPYFTTKETGTGIGLYMNKEILKRMNFDIYLKDNKTFVIDFAGGGRVISMYRS